MISIFGIVSVVVALISVAIIVLHNQVMSKRTPVDTHLEALEDLLRQYVEELYHTCHPDSELFDLCSQCVDLDFDSIVKALPDISRASEIDLYIDGHENIQAIQDTAEALNLAIEEYNNFITGRLPGKLMALVLGLTAEDKKVVATIFR